MITRQRRTTQILAFSTCPSNQPCIHSLFFFVGQMRARLWCLVACRRGCTGGGAESAPLPHLLTSSHAQISRCACGCLNPPLGIVLLTVSWVRPWGPEDDPLWEYLSARSTREAPGARDAPLDPKLLLKSRRSLRGKRHKGGGKSGEARRLSCHVSASRVPGGRRRREDQLDSF